MLESKFSGKCKDCGKTYKKGDNIDMNGNESPNNKGEMKPHWCPDGQNCQANMQLQGSANASDGALAAAEAAVANNAKIESPHDISSKIDGLEANYNALPDEEKQHYGIFALYLKHLKRCRDMGITNHIEAQMLFKAYVWRLSS